MTVKPDKKLLSLIETVLVELKKKKGITPSPSTINNKNVTVGHLVPFSPPLISGMEVIVPPILTKTSLAFDCSDND